MDFNYAEAFGKSSANGYERLLLDAMIGDGTLFAHRDGVEATWALMTPILEAWKKDPVKDFPNYAAGTGNPPQPTHSSSPKAASGANSNALASAIAFAVAVALALAFLICHPQRGSAFAVVVVFASRYARALALAL